MTSYLLLDSSFRNNAFYRQEVSPGNWEYKANDQRNGNSPITPTNYSVYWQNILNTNVLKSICPPDHCRPNPQHYTFQIDLQTVDIPAGALVRRVDNLGNVTYTSILDEPYLFVKIQSINSESNIISANNPYSKDATFVIWLDKKDVGPAGIASYNLPPANTPVTSTDISVVVSSMITPVPIASLTQYRFVQYKSGMKVSMRLSLQDELVIRIYDRYGNDVLLAESTDSLTSPPPTMLNNTGFVSLQEQLSLINPSLQTSILIGISPHQTICSTKPYENFLGLDGRP